MQLVSLGVDIVTPEDKLMGIGVARPAWYLVGWLVGR
jgi:hypothetical protein